VQGAKKVQGRSVFRHTLEFELFVATQQLGDLGQPANFLLPHPQIRAKKS
jgi:hypothetical protein